MWRQGWALTILLLCLGLSLLLIHHALDLVPPVWRAGIQASRRWAGPLAPAHERERRLQIRKIQRGGHCGGRASSDNPPARDVEVD